MEEQISSYAYILLKLNIQFKLYQFQSHNELIILLFPTPFNKWQRSIFIHANNNFMKKK